MDTPRWAWRCLTINDKHNAHPRPCTRFQGCSCTIMASGTWSNPTPTNALTFRPLLLNPQHAVVAKEVTVATDNSVARVCACITTSCDKLSEIPQHMSACAVCAAQLWQMLNRPHPNQPLHLHIHIYIPTMVASMVVAVPAAC